MTTKPVCVVVGVGEGNGAAPARAFAREDMAMALLARETDFTSTLAGELGDYVRAHVCDVSHEESIDEAFVRLRGDVRGRRQAVRGELVEGCRARVPSANRLPDLPNPGGAARRRLRDPRIPQMLGGLHRGGRR